MLHPKVRTDGGGGPGGRAEGAARPNWRAAWPTPQHTALHDVRVKRLNLTWDPHQSLGPDVEQFFHRPAGKCKEDAGGHFPTEPPAEEYEKWIEWS